MCPISFHIHICSGTPEVPSVLCAGIGEGKGSCPGDSGGPVTYKAGDQHVLIGDVSFGAKYCGGEEGTGHCRTDFSSLDIMHIINHITRAYLPTRAFSLLKVPTLKNIDIYHYKVVST